MGADHKLTPAVSGFFAFAKPRSHPHRGFLDYANSCMKALSCPSTLFSSLSATYFLVSIHLLSAHPQDFLLAISNLSFVILSETPWLLSFSIQTISVRPFWLCFHLRCCVPPIAVLKKQLNIFTFFTLFLSASVSKPIT